MTLRLVAGLVVLPVAALAQAPLDHLDDPPEVPDADEREEIASVADDVVGVEHAIAHVRNDAAKGYEIPELRPTGVVEADEFAVEYRVANVQTGAQ